MNRKSSMVAAGLLAAVIGMSVCKSWYDRNDCVGNQIRHIRAEVYELSADCNTVTFCDGQGELWAAEVESVNCFEIGGMYTLSFDDMGTTDIYDDEIIGIS